MNKFNDALGCRGTLVGNYCLKEIHSNSTYYLEVVAMRFFNKFKQDTIKKYQAYPKVVKADLWF